MDAPSSCEMNQKWWLLNFDCFNNADLLTLIEKFEASSKSKLAWFDSMVFNLTPTASISSLSTFSMDSPELSDSSIFACTDIDDYTLDLDTEFASYLLELEMKQLIPADFMDKQAEVTPSMRAILIDWMYHAHKHLAIKLETLYMAVAIIDRYLTAVADTKLTEFQLVGIAALRLASKLSEPNGPKIGEYLQITGDIFDAKLIRDMEIKVFSSLHFDLPRPVSIQFLSFLLSDIHAGKPVEILAINFLELATFDSELIVYKPTEVAATSLLIAIYMGRAKSDLTDLDIKQWTEDLETLTEHPFKHLQPIAEKIAVLALKAPKNNLKAVLLKYNSNIGDDSVYRLVLNKVTRSCRMFNH